MSGQPPQQSLYEILGVTHNATPEEIKRAKRKLSSQWHPDRNQQNPEQAAEMQRAINQAYEVLSDTERRAAYDEHGTTSPLNLDRQQATNEILTLYNSLLQQHDYALNMDYTALIRHGINQASDADRQELEKIPARLERIKRLSNRTDSDEIKNILSQSAQTQTQLQSVIPENIRKRGVMLELLEGLTIDQVRELHHGSSGSGSGTIYWTNTR